MSDLACSCWTNNHRLGHEGHCCFLHEDRLTWRDDDEVCHKSFEEEGA